MQSSHAMWGDPVEEARWQRDNPANIARANAESIRLLEQLLDARVTLVRGMGSRQKVFNVAGLEVETVLRKLGIG